MPKLIDQNERREEIAASAWQVILREGVGGATVRAVAAEAGLSVGSLRHVFASQSELLEFAMRLVIDRVSARIGVLLPQATLQSTEEIAAELLPLDDERRAEMEVYLALFAAAGADVSLREVRDEAWKSTRDVCRMILALLWPNQPATERERECEVAHLHALLDGLAAHLVWQSGDSYPQRAREVLARHLRSLAEQAG